MTTTPPSEDDGITRTPANENPWYILMTLHGEYEDSLSKEEINNLREDNRLSFEHFINGTPFQKASSIELFIRRAPKLLCPNDYSSYNFDNTIFSKDIYLFRGPIDNTNFKNCFFKGKLLVDSLSNTDFSGSVFYKEFHIRNTDSKRELNFNNCFFYEETIFEAKENTLLNLSGTTFHKNLLIKNSYDHIICNKTVFKDFVILNDLRIIKSARFYHAKFYKTSKFPKDLHENVSFQGADFSPIIRHYKNTEEASEGLLYFQILKKYMENNKRHHDEMLFFKYEMQTLEYLNSLEKHDWLKNIPSKLYGFFSDYGASILRPAIGLFICHLTCTFFYYRNIFECALQNLTNCPESPIKPLEAFYAATSISAINTFAPFGLQKLLNISDEINKIPQSHLLISLQMLLSIIFLFLLGLGLRNRFKIK